MSLLQSLIRIYRAYKIEFYIFLFFTLFYSFLSLYRHYNFGSGYWDLGFNNHGIWQYAHLKLARHLANPHLFMLADHFAPALMLYAPFYYLFGSYTLLIVQIFFVLLAGLGIIRYVNVLYPHLKRYVPFYLCYFFIGWGVLEALRFDFHNNIPSAMCIPWLILFYKTKNKKWFFIVYFFMILCQENVSFQIAFIFLALMAERLFRKSPPPPKIKSVHLLL